MSGCNSWLIPCAHKRLQQQDSHLTRKQTFFTHPWKENAVLLLTSGWAYQGFWNTHLTLSLRKDTEVSWYLGRTTHWARTADLHEQSHVLIVHVFRWNYSGLWQPDYWILAWNWSWWEYLHHEHQQILQVGAFLFPRTVSLSAYHWTLVSPISKSPALG